MITQITKIQLYRTVTNDIFGNFHVLIDYFDDDTPQCQRQTAVKFNTEKQAREYIEKLKTTFDPFTGKVKRISDN